MTDTLQVLIDARKLIEKPESWCQGRFHDGNGARCSAGAMMDVILDRSCDETEQRNLYMGAKTAFEKEAGTYTLTFNDASDRKHSEVLAVFDRAIEAERLAGKNDDRTDRQREGKLS